VTRVATLQVCRKKSRLEMGTTRQTDERTHKGGVKRGSACTLKAILVWGMRLSCPHSHALE